jgi:hypothetical protein
MSSARETSHSVEVLGAHNHDSSTPQAHSTPEDGQKMARRWPEDGQKMARRWPEDGHRVPNPVTVKSLFPKSRLLKSPPARRTHGKRQTNVWHQRCFIRRYPPSAVRPPPRSNLAAFFYLPSIDPVVLASNLDRSQAIMRSCVFSLLRRFFVFSFQ